jgi:RNA polymerase sigma-70 factor (ECF subfamily)
MEDHGSLGRLFIASLGRRGDAAASAIVLGPGATPGDLDAALAEAVRSGRAAWPEIDVPVAEFVAFVAGKLAREALRDDAPAAVRAVRAAELWLVAACARGDSRAIATLEARYGPSIVVAARRRADKGNLAEEAKQVLFARLFVAEGDAPPKIVEYAGRGDLGAFLKRRAAAGDAAGAEPLPLDDPELARVAARYHDDFKEALRDAARGLTTRERNLLRQHHIDGLTMVELATMYGLHRVTVVRAIQAAREKLSAGTRERLRERLRIDVTELESLFRVVASNLDLSIQRYLLTAS